MTRGEEQIEALLEAVGVDSDGAFRWFGRTLPAVTSHEGLVRVLTRRLYDDFYCAGMPIDRRPHPCTGGATTASATFVESLADAAAVRTCARPGWRPVGRSETSVIVEKSGVRFRAPSSAVLLSEDGLATVRIPARLRGLSPGFVTLLGSRTPEEGDPVVRFYWNLTAAAAVGLISRLTTALEGTAIRYRLKVSDDPGGFARCDAGVLYVREADARTVMAMARTLATDLGRGLEPGVPALALRLAPGLALAHEPPLGRSFGEHRCTLLAEALIRAREGGAVTMRERTEVIRRRFADEGIRLSSPWRISDPVP